MVDAIVVGGGIVGASAAYHLVCGGARTLLIDRADPGRATDAGAGIITAGPGGLRSDPWFDLALNAEDYYPVLVEQLKGAQAGETGYAPCGLLRVAMADDEMQALGYLKALLAGRAADVLQQADFDEVSVGVARTLFPPLGAVQGALYFRKAARVDGRQMSEALVRAAMQRGLEVRRSGVERLLIEPSEDRVTGVFADGETLSADRVIVAGGAWSRAFAGQLGVDIPVQPMRGQIIHFGLPGADTTNWPIVEPFRSHYLVCWPDSRVVAGATRERAGFDPRLTAGGVHEVLSEALRVAPGLASAEIREIRVGLRPATSDNLPVLGLVPGVDGIYLATGMGATGLHLGPYCGKLAADWVLGQEQQDIAAFSVARFNPQSGSKPPK
jgi:D-amino-acid dehydrogenase